MSTEKRTRLVAPCGIDCGACELHLCKDHPQMMAYLVLKGVPQEKLPCSGCRDLKGMCPVIAAQCETYACAAGKNIHFCFRCEEFPCSKLNPSADRADVLPHNLKVFNLCTIQKDGLEGFINQSTEIKKRYYKGKMSIGKGPQI